MEFPLPPQLRGLIEILLGGKENITSAYLGVENPLILIYGAAITVALVIIGYYFTGWRARRLVARFIHPLAGVASHYLGEQGSPGSRSAIVIVALEALVLLSLLLALSGPKAVLVVNTTLNKTVIGEFKVNARPALVLVIDVSGSMQGQKIEAAKKALLRVLDIARKRGLDVGLIAFNHHIVAAIPPGSSTSILRRQIENLKAEGGTMYTYPLLTCLEWLKPYRAFKIPVAVVFATDGLPADAASYRYLLPEYRKLGIPIYTVFIGSMAAGIGETKLIARKTGGEQYTAKNVEEIEKTLVSIAEKAVKNIVKAEVEAKITTTVRREISLAPLMAPTALLLLLAAYAARHRYTKIVA